MQTQWWDFSLINLSYFKSNQYTTLSDSIWLFQWLKHLDLIKETWPGNEVERQQLKLALYTLPGQWKSDLIFEHIPQVALVNKESSSFRLHGHISLSSSQLNHFSLTCSFVHLPKCKISSEQRSKNVNNKKNNSVYHRLLKTEANTKHWYIKCK